MEIHSRGLEIIKSGRGEKRTGEGGGKIFTLMFSQLEQPPRRPFLNYLTLDKSVSRLSRVFTRGDWWDQLLLGKREGRGDTRSRAYQSALVSAKLRDTFIRAAILTWTLKTRSELFIPPVIDHFSVSISARKLFLTSPYDAFSDLALQIELHEHRHWTLTRACTSVRKYIGY